MSDRRVLVIEDDSAIMETLSIFLRYEGYDVLNATSAAEAIRLAHASRPDLVLLDYMLGDNTAEPVVDALRERFGADVRILLLTAADDPQGKSERLRTDAMVSKPFELDLLLREIRKCLERRPKGAPLMRRKGAGNLPAPWAPRSA